jgi:hypothetical protein
MDTAPVLEVKQLNIYQRLNEVRKDVSYLRKTKEVTGAGTYKVITHDQVTGEIRESLIKHGVMIVPRLVSSKTVDTGTTTAKGIPIIRYEPWYELDFVNIDQPEQKVTVPIEAHALDQGDKAPGKAISYATKYAILKLFSIESGDEEEDRAELKAAKSGMKESSKTIARSASENLTNEQKFKVQQILSTVVDCLEADMVGEACNAIDEANFEIEEKLGLWAELDSKQRSAITKEKDRRKKENLKSQEATQP